MQFGAADDEAIDLVASPAPAGTLAERIQADIRARKVRKVILTHPMVPAWRVECRLPQDRRELKPLSDASERAENRGEPPTYDSALLATYATQVWFMGELVTDPTSGKPVTFRDKAFKEIIGQPAGTASQAVEAVFGDGPIGSLAWKLLDEAGFRTENQVEVEGEDPTSAG